MLDLDLGGIVSSVESSFRETIFNDPLITGVKGRTFLTTFYFILFLMNLNLKLPPESLKKVTMVALSIPPLMMMYVWLL